MTTNRGASARFGILAGGLLLAALLLVSGCSTNSITGPPLADQQIFVVQDVSVSAFPLTASGNAAPTATLSGGLENAHRLAFDSKFSGYVTDAGANSVNIYAPGSKGNTAPRATISGADTGLDFPEGIDLDSANNIYVANRDGNSVTVYAAGPTGDATPVLDIVGANTLLNAPNGLVVDPGANIYVANEGGNSVTIFAAGSTGNVAPAVTISGAATGINRPHDLTLDTAGNLYVTNGNANSVTIYAAADIAAAGGVTNLAPVATIVGAATGLNNPNGIAVDASGNLYVTNNLTSVMIYSAADIAAAITAGGANNKAPVATITGAATGFSDVHGVRVQTVP